MQPTKLLPLWQRLNRWPGGGRLFSFLIGRTARYSGSIGARVVAMKPGATTVTLADRRRVRNHLGSIHAIALANLAELASGLAMLTSLSDGQRGIVTNFTISYLKKARGTITAIGNASATESSQPVECEAHAELRDQTGEVVATARVAWLISPRPE